LSILGTQTVYRKEKQIMSTSLKKLIPLWAVGLTVLTILPAAGHAQLRSFPVQRAMAMRTFSVNPILISQPQPFLGSPFGFNSNLGYGFTGFRGFAATPFGNPYTSPFGSPYGYSALGTPLYGAYPSYAPAYGSSYGSGYGSQYGSGYGSGDSLSSVDRFLQIQQQAPLLEEQARAARLANRRKIFDEYLYEREKTPTAEDERQRHDLEQLQRSIHNPPVTEILSRMALNNILRELRKQFGNDHMAEPATFPLDEAQLRHINVTRARGNIALLKKNDGRLSWPVALMESSFREEREQLASEALEAVRQAKANKPVDLELVRQLKGHVDALRQKVRKQAGMWSSREYIEANTFLGNLDQALVALGQPDIASHFNGTYALTARSVPELVKQMTQRGLEFARALAGDEAAYIQLHQALAASASAVTTKLAAQ
jgi:hypothetical protein